VVGLGRKFAGDAEATVPEVTAGVAVGAIALAYLLTGVNTARGTTAGVVGAAVGSLVFGVLFCGLSAMVMVTGAAGPGPGGDPDAKVAALLGGAAVGVAGAGLLLAGLLALAGRSAYAEWREAFGPAEPERPRRRADAGRRRDDDR
jgi:hypothetical protein